MEEKIGQLGKARRTSGGDGGEKQRKEREEKGKEEPDWRLWKSGCETVEVRRLMVEIEMWEEKKVYKKYERKMKLGLTWEEGI